MNVHDIITLSELLAEMGHVKRGTKLPNGEFEPDSHHSFSLALVAYHVVSTECPELDASRVLLFALVHDLLEVVTGDEDTLHFTPEQHAVKHQREQEAAAEFDELFAKFPELKQALWEYERLDTPEAATVFVLDKACTTWTHHVDAATYARQRSITCRQDVEAWAHRQRDKFEKRLRAQPPKVILDLYEDSFIALRDLYDK